MEAHLLQKRLSQPAYTRGIDKQKVKMVHFYGWFAIKFPNLVYSIRKEISGYTAKPEGVKTWREFQTVIGLKPDEFAQFLFAFDAIYPDILQAVGDVMTSVQEIILQRKKEHMIQQLQEVTVRGMLDQYLKPLKIRAGFFLENGVVNLSLRMGKNSKDTSAFLLKNFGKSSRTLKAS